MNAGCVFTDTPPHTHTPARHATAPTSRLRLTGPPLLEAADSAVDAPPPHCMHLVWQQCPAPPMHLGAAHMCAPVPTPSRRQLRPSGHSFTNAHQFEQFSAPHAQSTAACQAATVWSAGLQAPAPRKPYTPPRARPASLSAATTSLLLAAPARPASPLRLHCSPTSGTPRLSVPQRPPPAAARPAGARPRAARNRCNAVGTPVLRAASSSLPLTR